MSSKKDDLQKQLQSKLIDDTLKQLEDCEKIIKVLKQINLDEFDNLEPHFLLQYYDTYKDVKTAVEVLVHHNLLKRNLVDAVLIKFIRNIRKKYQEEWYSKNKKEWFGFLKQIGFSQ